MAQSNQDKFPLCQWKEYKEHKIKYVTAEDIISVHGEDFFRHFERLSRGDTRAMGDDNTAMIYYCDYLNHRSSILLGKELFWD